ncbi:MAG: 2-oxoacid:acceptor oxidoreductase family protein [Deltaproteobacteria bacterium]|nr:2-oxoacid:acceptor oxidoreductase family protein [Deltaproteobacteria bacterium]
MTVNILICGVGGQGIGLMGEVLCETLLQAGEMVMATETHGVAQRGGIVTTHIRYGKGVRTPKIDAGEADFVFALERLEGARVARHMLRPGGKLIYYDTVQQPQSTRAHGVPYPDARVVKEMCRARGVEASHIFVPNLQGPQMQNVALLGYIATRRLISAVTRDSVRNALLKLLPAKVRAHNLQVFDSACGYALKAQKNHDCQVSLKDNADASKEDAATIRSFPIIAGA